MARSLALCPDELRDGWMLCHNFQVFHPFDRIVIPTEGYFPRCERCRMQVNPTYLRHTRTKEYGVGIEQWLQQGSAISSALSLWCNFTINGSVLECVKVFKYLVDCWRRTTMMHRPSGSRCRRPGEFGPE